MSAVNCLKCNKILTMPPDGQVWTRCPSCQGMVFISTAGPRVLIAHESEHVCQYIGSVLLGAGFSPLRARHGGQAIEIMEAHRPPAAVLDVALGQVLAFQVIEHLRNIPHLRDTRVVLLASVYDKTAYKRRPTSLYGADDYIEQHHIPDMLPKKLGTLLNISLAPTGEVSPERFDRIRDAEKLSNLSGMEKIRALAHNIVSDIALYNEENIQQAVRNGNFEALAPVLEEGRRLLAELAPGEDIGESDHILEAFNTLVDELRRDRQE